MTKRSETAVRKAPVLLALDLSSVSTGYALGGERDGSPRLGTWIMPGGKEAVFGRTLAGLARTIDSFVKEFQVRHVYIEEPLVLLRGRNPWSGESYERSAHTLEVLQRLTGAAHAAGVLAGATVDLIEVPTIRRHFTGRAHSGNKNDPKAHVKERCRLLGWAFADDNQADAAALWSYGMSTRYPHWSPLSTPLFARRLHSAIPKDVG